MKRVPRLHITLRRSRRVVLWFAVPTAATALLLWMLPWPWWALLPADLALMVWACWASRRLAPQGLPGGVAALTLSADRQLHLYFAGTAAGAEGLPARVLAGTSLNDAFLTIVWRSEKPSQSCRAQRSRTLFLLPDMMGADDWRRLRILLQHGRETPESAGGGEEV